MSDQQKDVFDECIDVLSDTVYVVVREDRSENQHKNKVITKRLSLKDAYNFFIAESTRHRTFIERVFDSKTSVYIAHYKDTNKPLSVSEINGEFYILRDSFTTMSGFTSGVVTDYSILGNNRKYTL